MQSSRESWGSGSESVLGSTVPRRSRASNSRCLAFLAGDLLQLSPFYQQTDLFCFIISFGLKSKSHYSHATKACFKGIFRTSVENRWNLLPAQPVTWLKILLEYEQKGLLSISINKIFFISIYLKICSNADFIRHVEVQTICPFYVKWL